MHIKRSRRKPFITGLRLYLEFCGTNHINWSGKLCCQFLERRELTEGKSNDYYHDLRLKLGTEGYWVKNQRKTNWFDFKFWSLQNQRFCGNIWKSR